MILYLKINNYTPIHNAYIIIINGRTTQSFLSNFFFLESVNLSRFLRIMGWITPHFCLFNSTPVQKKRRSTFPKNAILFHLTTQSCQVHNHGTSPSYASALCVLHTAPPPLPAKLAQNEPFDLRLHEYLSLISFIKYSPAEGVSLKRRVL